MLDTNQVNQVAETAAAAKAVAIQWWPTIAIASAWLGRELHNAERAIVELIRKIDAAGGLRPCWRKFLGPKA